MNTTRLPPASSDSQSPGIAPAGAASAAATTTTQLPRLAQFPKGQRLLPRLPFREEVFQTVQEILDGGQCDHGRFEIETRERRLTCLIHHGAPFRAGLQEGSSFSIVPLAEFPARAEELKPASCRLVRCDATEILIEAVHFAKQPALRSSVRFVDPAKVLEVLAAERQDAALSFLRKDARTLLFLHAGRPKRLYFANPEDDPGEGSLEERMLLYAFGPDGAEGIVEVFNDLKLPSDPDAGSSLMDLVTASSPAPPATVFVHMDGHEVRQRPFSGPSMVIGRDPKVDIFVDNLGVSRRHALLSWHRGEFVIEDLGSSNGTFVGEKRVGERHRLKDGDKVRFSKFELTVVRTAVEQQAPETMFVRPSDMPSLMPPPVLAGAGARVPVDRHLILGKGDGVDIRASGWGVGAVHARVVPDKKYGRARIECFDKRRVTVDGRSVTRAEIEIGQSFSIGGSEFKLLPGEI